MGITTDPAAPCLKSGQKAEGQNSCYLVLSDEERAKGFVRPYRTSYVHRGKLLPVIEEGVTLRELNDNEKKHDWAGAYAAKLEFSEEWGSKNNSAISGQYLTPQEYAAIKKGDKHAGGCGTLTTMGKAIAETYARDPKFYGATFCCGCNRHIALEEFVWDGTNETVGS